DTATPLERPNAFAEQAYLRMLKRGNTNNTIWGIVRVRWTPELRIAPTPTSRSRGTCCRISAPPSSLILRAAKCPPLRPTHQRLRPHFADGPEDRPLPARCLSLGGGPPMMPVFYNNNLFILQTETTVVILNEMIHDVRVIPLDGRPHLPASLRQWRGDPRGRW